MLRSVVRFHLAPQKDETPAQLRSLHVSLNSQSAKMSGSFVPRGQSHSQSGGASAEYVGVVARAAVIAAEIVDSGLRIFTKVASLPCAFVLRRGAVKIWRE